MVKYDISYGIIPMRAKGEGWQVLLVYHGKGFWAFPKGHAEAGENQQQAAMRELEEETNLSVLKLIDLPPFKENYFFREGPHLIHKTVIYWAAEVGGEIRLQEEEIADCKWVILKEAHNLATFPQAKQMCAQLCLMLERTA